MKGKEFLLRTPKGEVPKACLFDFDLTLADGSKWIIECYKRVLKEQGFPPANDEDIRRTIGLTIEDSFGRLTGITDYAKLHALRLEYKKVCRPEMAAHTFFFPDAVSFLKRAKKAGIRLAIISTKETGAIRETLSLWKLDDLFCKVIGLDEVSQPKPSPEGILHALESLEIGCGEAVYFGDSIVDGQAAQNAKVGYVAVAKGVHKAEELLRYEPLAVISDYSQIEV